ncbi:MAG: site-2 protease family protein [Bryobacteraceae bacterium]
MSELGFSGTLNRYTETGAAVRAPRRWWLHILLLLLTLLTTTTFGFALSKSFAAGSTFDVGWWVQAYTRLLHGDPALWAGFQFSLPLLTILVAHELGHYAACRIWRVDASLPFFLPSPALLGTFGAFILIRSPLYRRKALFDIGVAGPIAGFVVLLPFLVGGIALSRVEPGIGAHGSFLFGTPLLLRLVELAIFPGVPVSSIALHPMAMAAWAGLLATALNLLPIGQLDGGHIVYALFGERWHRTASTMAVAALFVLGFFYWPWWFWALLMLLFGRRHRLVYDSAGLSRTRVAVGCLAAAMLVLSFSVVPVRTG